ncbi:MAG: iron ABC transporter substrate-binding protein, partial [Firmicutes bacterium]|nr:iron ABC transporter substrate-binding protein [Bacillota bacterium]
YREFLAERGPSLPVRNYHPRAGDAGAMVNVPGVGLLKTSRHKEAALRLIDFLLSRQAQEYFARRTYEYPLVAGVPAHPDLVPLHRIKTPDIDLGDLADLEATLNLLWETGVL